MKTDGQGYCEKHDRYHRILDAAGGGCPQCAGEIWLSLRGWRRWLDDEIDEMGEEDW